MAIAAAAIFLPPMLSGGPAGPPRAAIVDQLSLTFPNPSFIERVTATLEQTEYAVDYYPGEEVTVEFYRRLPSDGYDVIIFRTHASRVTSTAGGREVDDVALFTSEAYSNQKYPDDLLNRRLMVASYYEGGEQYFGIAAGFIEDAMQGNFGGATIVMMGCEGLITERTAKAFVEKGAETYISWDESVSASHTDMATERLLEHLLIEGQPPERAVALTMAEVGHDPSYGSSLLAYP